MWCHGPSLKQERRRLSGMMSDWIPYPMHVRWWSMEWWCGSNLNGAWVGQIYTVGRGRFCTLWLWENIESMEVNELGSIMVLIQDLDYSSPHIREILWHYLHVENGLALVWSWLDEKRRVTNII